MRRLLLIPLLLVTSLVLGACATGTSVLQGGDSLFATIQNPAQSTQLAQLELSYQASAQAFIICRNTHCTSSANLRKYQALDKKAYASLVTARNFIRKNPNVSAVSLVAAARTAVSDFQAAVGR